ncbi:MAG: cellulose-binding family [Frankiales bacterium]|nr:cellulose-binding family [Frankiales bacterium]
MQVRSHLSVLAALALGAAALTFAPVAGATASSPLLPAGPLGVVGNRIVDGAGNTLILRGIHRDGLEAVKSKNISSVPTDDEIARIGNYPGTGWNANIVRVPVGAPQWTGACPLLFTPSATSYQAIVDATVSSITRRGMIALLDLHETAPGCGAISRHWMPDDAGVRPFWQSAAAHYDNNPLVAFELFNEPFNVDQPTWRDGTDTATFQECLNPGPSATQLQKTTYQKCLLTAPKYQAMGMQDLVDLVHGIAPTHLLVVDGPNYAQTAPAAPLAEPDTSHPKIAYAVHPYTCTQPTSACNDPATYAHAATSILGAFKAFSDSNQVPVLATEFGWPTHTGAAGENAGPGFFTDTFAFFRAQSPQWGYTAFAMDGQTQGAYSLLDDASTLHPNITGATVKSDIAATW